jgi:type IV pilus assembly protein PilA
VRSISLQRGFTLLELLTVMAIISILAMVAMPAYQTYMIRTKVSEDFATAGKIKTMVEEYYAVMGVMPLENEQLGLDNERNIKGVRLERAGIEDEPMPGTIKLHYDHRVALRELGSDNEIKFVPEVVNGRIVWECKSGDMLDKYRPPECRGESKYPD